jgi:hypothetical protein
MTSEPTPHSSDLDADLDALGVRLSRLEAQVLAHAERLAEFDAAARGRQRRALWIRLVLLALALVAFFVIKQWGPGAGS